MAEQRRQKQSFGGQQNDTFKRHGPEPPENDSGPSPSVEETTRATNKESGEQEPSSRDSDGKRQ